MREIKFRLWNLKNKYMFSNDNEELLLNIDGSSLWGHKIHYYDGTDLLEIDNFEIMQYTGLKDSNGVEIYEGDIVKASSRGIWGRFQVKWRQDGSPCWIMYPAWKSGIAWSLHGTLNDKGEYIDDVEVIGNIYENPELLEGLKNG